LLPLDFERDDLISALTGQGYCTDARTFFIWEGVTQYLTEDAVRATLGSLQSAVPGSRLVFTYVRRDFIDGVNLYDAALLYKRFRQRHQVWRFGLDPDAVSTFIAEYGWRLVEQAGPDYYLRNYIEPTGRNLTASQVEWTAYAEKVSFANQP
jgi:methyltransferase (TIGR00027 family)